MRNLFARIGAWCVERPGPAIALAVLLALVGAVGALSLRPNGEAETLVDRGSETFEATEQFKEEFGDDAVVVLVRGDLEQLVLTENLGRLLILESCLAGTAEADQIARNTPTPEVCTKLADTRPARVVYGPATFLNQFALQANKLLEEQSQATVVRSEQQGVLAARKVLRQGGTEAEAKAAYNAAKAFVIGQFEQQLRTLAVRYGQTSLPKLDDPTYVSSVVFDTRFAGGIPKARFSYLFPSEKSALISVRLRPELSEAERGEAIDLIRQAVADPAFKLRGGEYLVSGVPVVADGLADKLGSEIVLLLIVAVLVMALVLALVFGPSLRLLPLLIALAASAITFGALALVGGELTMASIAVLPILIGLGVDYAIQFQARFNEFRESGSSPPRAAAEAAAAGGPVIATACLATAAGFLVLLLSPIPMIRSFGVLLVAGIAIAFAVALTAGLAVLSMSKPAVRGPQSADGGRRFGAERFSAIGTRVRGGLSGAGNQALARSVATPGRVILAAGLLAVAGWVAGTRTEVISDIRELVPRDLPELQNVDALQEETGVSGEVDVTVTAPDLSDPELIRWMGDYRERVLELGGFGGQFPSCRDEATDLCPAISLPDLFGTDQAIPDAERIRTVLGLLPAYFAQAVVETDPETGQIGDTAVLAFGIKLMPFDEQKELIDGIRAEINPPGTENDPPPGVEAAVVGLPVLAADANAALSSNRYLLTVAGLLAVALALLAAYRSFARALVPLVPIVFATGWSALVLEAAGVPLNPMSATLGALVIAIATEFSVLLSARFHEERGKGSSVGEALRQAYARTGAAVMASGVTAIAGFAALIATDIRMLRDFGLVTVFDLTVALAGVLLVLPAVLVWAEGGFEPVRGWLTRRRRQPRPAEL